MSLTSRMLCKAFTLADNQKNKGQTTPEDIVRYDNIVYGPDFKWHVLDVYRPRDTGENLPVIIDVHGGGWVYGDKDVYQFYCMSLARRGFAVVNFTYRLAPDYIFPSSMEDTDLAVRFLLSHADEYGFDLDNVFMVGDSAGAHMVCMYCLMCTDKAYAKEAVGIVPPEGFVPKAVVLNCGIYDIIQMMKSQNASVILLKPLVKDLLGVDRLTEEVEKEKERILSPCRFINPDFPPAFVMTCNADFLIEQPDYLLPQFGKNGIKYVFKTYGEAGGKPLAHVFHCDPRLPEAKVCNDEEMAFLKSYLEKTDE